MTEPILVIDERTPEEKLADSKKANEFLHSKIDEWFKRLTAMCSMSRDTNRQCMIDQIEQCLASLEHASKGSDSPAFTLLVLAKCWEMDWSHAEGARRKLLAKCERYEAALREVLDVPPVHSFYDEAKGIIRKALEDIGDE